MLSGARALRISCKLDPQDNTVLMTHLRQVWRQLRTVGQEHLTRLRVCAVFHRNVTDVSSKIIYPCETHTSKYSPLLFFFQTSIFFRTALRETARNDRDGGIALAEAEQVGHALGSWFARGNTSSGTVQSRNQGRVGQEGKAPAGGRTNG